MGDKINVAVLMGGPSLEYEVSLASGKTVIQNIDKDKYNVIPVIVAKNALWSIYDAQRYPEISPIDFKVWLSCTDELSLSQALNLLIEKRVDLCFIAMHGSYGEDGTLQAVLEAHKIPYTGSRMIPSGIAMDKIVYKRILLAAGINVANSIFMFPDSIESEINVLENVSLQIGFPCVVKTPSSGSSIGVEICLAREDFFPIINKLFPIDNRLLIEKYISGREFTCSVIGNAYSKDINALPPTEIITKNAFFDFEAKYTPGAAKEITPAPISCELTRQIQQTAVWVHNIIGCSGMSRTDMIVQEDDQIFVLETNTIPGMTAQSLLPQAASASGMNMTQLIDKIIKFAIDEFGKKSQAVLSPVNKI